MCDHYHLSESRQCRAVQVPRLLEQSLYVCAAGSSVVEPERGHAGKGVADGDLGQTPAPQFAARQRVAISPPPVPPTWEPSAPGGVFHALPRATGRVERSTPLWCTDGATGEGSGTSPSCWPRLPIGYAGGCRWAWCIPE
eukprot:53052-Rhodomonas_salina.2